MEHHVGVGERKKTFYNQYSVSTTKVQTVKSSFFRPLAMLKFS